MNKRAQVLAFLLLAMFTSIQAQTTQFGYQGSLSSSGTPANGNYDFEFALFESGGSQIGSTLTRTNVPVVNGVFSVTLDFGNNYTGANRELEVRVRLSGAGTFTVLAPRQTLRATPYSIVAVNALMSLNATNATNATNAVNAANASQLGGINSNQYVLTTDPRMTDARNPLPNSASYIQNRTTQQAATNFNISGSGNADIFNVASHYSIRGNRVLQIGGQGSFTTAVGVGTSVAGGNNTVYGNGAGNPLGTAGQSNSFFGLNAGTATTSGSSNTFIGNASGLSNTTGLQNTFVGDSSGADSNGSRNSYFGHAAGNGFVSGQENTFIGESAGAGFSSGTRISLLGTSANTSGGLLNASAIGARAFVTQNHSLVLGSINGVNGSTFDTNVGIGTTAPAGKLHIGSNLGNILLGDAGCPSGQTALGFLAPMSGCMNYALRGGSNDLFINRPVGGVMTFRENNGASQLHIASGGNIGIGTASPTERLHVNGNAFVSGSSSVGSSLTVNGVITFGGDLSSGGNANFAGPLFAGGAVNTSAHYRINGSQVLTRSRLDLFNTAAVPRGYSFEVLNSPSFLVLRNDGGSTIMTIAPDGKVGIGDNNPIEATLEVGGTLAVSNLGGVDGEHLCRNGNLIRACSVAVANNLNQIESSVSRIETLESTVRQQQAEIERQRKGLAELKSFICGQRPAAEICRQ